MNDNFTIGLLFLAGLACIVLRQPPVNYSSSTGNISAGGLPSPAVMPSSGALDAFINDLADRNPDLFPGTKDYLANHPVQAPAPGFTGLASGALWGLGQLI